MARCCSAAKYGDLDYWDSQFADGIYGETYEWVADFEVLRPLIQPLIDVAGGPHRCRVLHLGCGNSELAEQLYDEFGVRRCTSVDFSPRVIEFMRQRNAATRPELEWVVADCTDLRSCFKDQAFDLVLEKGFLDALVCISDTRRRCESVHAALKEVARVLMPGGSFLMASVNPDRPQELYRLLMGNDLPMGRCFPELKLHRTEPLPSPPGAASLLWPADATAFFFLRERARDHDEDPDDDGSGQAADASPSGDRRGGSKKAVSATAPWKVNHYGCGAQYWDERYAKAKQPFEWLRHYSHVEDLIEVATGGDRSCRILHVGCGDSALGEKMHEAGFRSQTNIDISSVVIGQMAEKYRELSGLSWIVMDATRMEFGSESFDCIIDKSLIDTLVCLPIVERAVAVSRYVSEVIRVLRPGGTFLCVSFGSPSERGRYFKSPDLSVDIRELPPTHKYCTVHYAYCCQKSSTAVSSRRWKSGRRASHAEAGVVQEDRSVNTCWVHLEEMD